MATTTTSSDPPPPCSSKGFIDSIVPTVTSVAGLGLTAWGLSELPVKLPTGVDLALVAGGTVFGYSYGKALVADENDRDFWERAAGGAAGATLGGVAGSYLVPGESEYIAVVAGGTIGLAVGVFGLYQLMRPGTFVASGILGIANSVSGYLRYGACEIAHGIGETGHVIDQGGQTYFQRCKSGAQPNVRNDWAQALANLPVLQKPRPLPLANVLGFMNNPQYINYFGSKQFREMKVGSNWSTSPAVFGCATPQEFLNSDTSVARHFMSFWRNYAYQCRVEFPITNPPAFSCSGSTDCQAVCGGQGHGANSAGAMMLR